MIAASGKALWWVWIVMVVGAAGTLLYAGVKIPFFTFFARDSSKRPKEAPLNMLLVILCSFVSWGEMPY